MLNMENKYILELTEEELTYLKNCIGELLVLSKKIPKKLHTNNSNLLLNINNKLQTL